MQYGFLGYALFATTQADEIEPWPPNYAPEISAEYPVDDAFNIPISTTELRFSISDQNSDLMDYYVTTDPYIGTGFGEQKPDGTYSISIDGLEGSEEYSWSVQVTDGLKTSYETYCFTTEPVAPIVSEPNPEDNQKYVSVSLSQLSFRIDDPQGDYMDYSVETVPDIGSGDGFGVTNGVYTVEVEGLDFSTDYLWFVNVTDGDNWKHKVFCFQSEPEMTFDPFVKGWLYRKEVVIDHNDVTGDLENFPVVISTVDSDLCDKAQFDGDDILFMDDVGVADRLFHEIEYFDGSSGELVAWVNLGQLSSSVDTTFYVYYGNFDACNQQASEMVWDSGFEAVWHMNDDPNPAYIKDSTSYGRHGTKKDFDQPLQTTGKIGDAEYFDGSDDYIDTQDFDIDDDFTICLWIKPSSTEYGQCFIGKHKTGTDENLILCGYWKKNDGSQGYSFNIRDSSHRDGIINLDWHQMVYVGEKTGPSTTNITVYKNGAILWQYDLIETVGDVSGGRDWTIGQDWDSTRTDFFNGTIDEIRISDNARSSCWISTEYNNQNDPSSFYNIGPEIPAP